VTWAESYEIGQPVKVRHQGGWSRGQVVTTRKNSCMVLLTRGGQQTTTNIHDPRNIQPCPSQSQPLTSNDQLSFD
jgi:hypothetical protein